MPHFPLVEVLSQGKGFPTMWPLSWFPSSELPAPTKENIRVPTNASGGEKNATDATTDDQSFRFSHFDVLQIPPDHHYIDTADEVFVASYRKTVHWVDELKINMHVSYSFLICAA
jgi:hypothetical protein